MIKFLCSKKIKNVTLHFGMKTVIYFVCLMPIVPIVTIL